MLTNHGCEYGLWERQLDLNDLVQQCYQSVQVGWFDKIIIETGSSQAIAITLLAVAGYRSQRGVDDLRHQAGKERS